MVCTRRGDAVFAQPLATEEPYGCGIPLAGASPGAGTENPNFMPLKTEVFSSKTADGNTAPPPTGCVRLFGDGEEFDDANRSRNGNLTKLRHRDVCTMLMREPLNQDLYGDDRSHLDFSLRRMPLHNRCMQGVLCTEFRECRFCYCSRYPHCSKGYGTPECFRNKP